MVSYAEAGSQSCRGGKSKQRNMRFVGMPFVISLVLILIGISVFAAQPVITGVSIPDASMKIGDTVTATIYVQSDAATFTMNASTIGGYALSSLGKTNDTTYTAQFTIISGGTDYAAGADIPTSVELEDTGLTDTWSTAISQASDLLDANYPTDPTPSSSSHVVSDWDNDDTIDIQVSGASDGSGSGVDGFEIEWDQSATWTPTETKEQEETWTGATFTATSDGDWYFHIATVDNAGNWTSTEHLGPFRIDTADPSVPTGLDPADGSYTTDTSPLLSWIASTDPSGIDNYRIVIAGPATRDTYVSDTDYNPSLGLDGTYTWRIYARDNAGNSSAYTADRTFTIDTEDPTCSVSIGTATIYDGDLVQEVTVDYGEEMTHAANAPTIQFTGTAGTWSSNSNGSWDVDFDQWTESFTITDAGEEVTATVTASGAADLAGNTQVSNQTTFQVDTENPAIFQIIRDDANPTNAAQVDMVIDFTEDVDGVTIDNFTRFGTGGQATASIDSVVTAGPAFWWIVRLNTVDDAMGTLTLDLDSNYSSITDAAGNELLVGHTFDEYYDVDRLDPTVTVDIIDTQLWDGNMSSEVTIEFSEEVVEGSINWTPTNGNVTAFTKVDGDSYTCTFTTLDGMSGHIGIVTIRDGYTDIIGNQGASGQGTIPIDTLNPTVSSIDYLDSATSYTVTTEVDTNDGANAAAVHVTFSEPMTTDGSADPTITFSPNVDSTLPPGSASTQWDSDTEFVWSTLEQDANIVFNSVTVDASGAKDAAGNDMEDYSPVHEFGIDTISPTLISLVVSDSLITDADTPGVQTFDIEVIFSEPMINDGSADPTFVFDPSVASTLTHNPPVDGWEGSDTEFITLYDVADANANIEDIDIDVTGVTDVNGNPLQGYTPSKEMDIDTLNPSATIVFTDALLTDADAESLVTITFNESVNNFTIADLTPTNGLLTSFTPVNLAEWTVLFTADDDADGTGSVTVGTAYEDYRGNPPNSGASGDTDIDTRNPSVLTVEADTSPIYEGDLQQGVIVTFDEPMDTATDPTITFGVGTFTSNSDGTWDSTTQYSESFTHTDTNIEQDFVEIGVSGAKDAAGNDQQPYTPEGEFHIDTIKPSVTDVTITDTEISDADVGGDKLRVTVEFDDYMSAPADPSSMLIFSPSVASTLSYDSYQPTAQDQMRFYYDISDANVDIDSVTIDVIGAVDYAGNVSEDYTPEHEFEIDTLNPTIVSISTNDSLITDDDTPGDATFVVTVEFSEGMSTGISPTVSFNPAVGTTLAFYTEDWPDSDTYTATYDVSDGNVDHDNVQIDVTGTQDIAGNPQEDYTPENEFGIDTVNPTVTTVAINTDPMYESDLIQQVVVTFDEAMDTGTDPSVTFGGGAFASNSDGAWTASDTVWTETFTLTDNDEEITGVTVGISAAKDAAGNNQQTYTAQIEFDIDTIKPSVLTVAVDTDPMYESDLIQQVTVTFDEPMDTGAEPVITFGAGTLASHSDGAWTVGDTVWTETFTLTDNNEEIGVVSIDVAGAEDVAGNAQEDRTILDAFSIDTVKPTITGISTNDPLITDDDTPGDATFVVTVEFSEAMDTGISPTVSFDLSVGTTLTLDGTSGWLDSDTYEAMYDTADGNVDHDNVQIDATGTQDAAGNVQEDYTPENEFGIDTVNPTVSAVAVDDTLLSDSDAGTSFTVTVNFSEAMQDDGTPYPTITFGPSVASTLSFTSGSWPTTTQYAAIYSVSDGGVDVDSVTIGVTFAEDENLNDQQAYTAAHEFEIDTLNPTVTGVALSDNNITDADVGDTLTVTIDYSEPMLTTAPNLVFSPSLDTTLSFQAGSSSWTDNDTYVASYTILDGNVTILDDDITITAAQDLAGNVQVGFNYDDQLDIDTENPYFHDFVVTGGAVDINCVREVTFTAKVTDPNGTMVPDDITVTSATTTNATIGAVYNISQTSDNQTTITITGSVDVSALTGCPAFVTITLDAVDSVDNMAAQQAQSDDVVDITIPVINDLMFNTDDTYSAPQLLPYLVDECGQIVVYFSATISDNNCCIVPGNVNVSVTLPMLIGEGPAILEDVVINRVQNGQGRVDVTGSAVVRCLESCPPGICLSRVQVDITATDCCGNVAIPDSTGVLEGLVGDIIRPIPQDDPRQDMAMDESAVIDPLVEVRLDELGIYRLVLRESTPVRIDIMRNDADNLSHNDDHPFEPCTSCGPCGGQTGCCAIMYIHDIVEHPSYGTAEIEDDEGDCHGGTVIRYAPDRAYLGPDYFTYRTRDAFGNISSVIATVYLQVVPEVWMEDIFVIACPGETVEFTVSAADLFIDYDDPSIIPFEFAIDVGPNHGVIGGSVLDIFYTEASEVLDSRFGELVPSLDFSEAAAITLTYTPADGFLGIDTARIRFEDPFGGVSYAVVNITVGDCGAVADTGVVLQFSQGQVLVLIVPMSFTGIYEAGWVDVILTSLEDGTVYVEPIAAEWSEQVNRHILTINTGALPVGSYDLTIPLGNGETVTLTIEVGEAK